ncbi:MAG: 2-hydroxyacyl-CoA dehydratase subunit D [Desulfatibacillaceae bacterium]
MRAAQTEYNFDWSLHSLFATASRVADGTPKEFERMARRIPDFKGVIEPVMAQGEAGKNFLKGVGAYLNKILTAHDQGKKLCMTTFCQSPAILYAMDVIPISLEPMTVAGTLVKNGGTGEFMDYCVEAGFTETSCSSQRGAMGAYLAGLCEQPDFVLIDTPGICDTNANSFSFFSAYMDIPFYQINYPPTLTDDRATGYHRADFRHMIAFLEEQTGRKLDLDKLREILIEQEKQDAIICELQDVQRLIPNPVPVLFNFFLYAGRFMMGGQPECTELLQSMLDIAKANAREGKSGLLSGREDIRGLFVYIDHYAANIPLWNFLESRNITHLGGILDRFYQDGAPYTQPGEGYTTSTSDLDSMIDTLAAQNSRMPMVKQIRGPYDAPNMWLDEAKGLAELYSVDFAVYSGTPGCRNTWGMVKLLVRDLERSGLPTFVVNADAFDDRVESWDQTQNRFEEFLDLRRIGK